MGLQTSFKEGHALYKPMYTCTHLGMAFFSPATEVWALNGESFASWHCSSGRVFPRAGTTFLKDLSPQVFSLGQTQQMQKKCASWLMMLNQFLNVYRTELMK